MTGIPWDTSDTSALPMRADSSSTLAMIQSVSFPLYDGPNGKRKKGVDPRAFTGGGGGDQNRAGRSYLEARSRAREIAIAAEVEVLPNVNGGFADCGGWVATVVINTIDPDYPWIRTGRQAAYLEDPKNDWARVGNTYDYTPNEYRPGDVFMSLDQEVLPGHTFVWLGDYQGKSQIVSEASYSKHIGSRTAHLPQIRAVVNDGEPGEYKDTTGRYYDVWRYVGDGKKLEAALANWGGRAEPADHTVSADLIAHILFPAKSEMNLSTPLV